METKFLPVKKENGILYLKKKENGILYLKKKENGIL